MRLIQCSTMTSLAVAGAIALAVTNLAWAGETKPAMPGNDMTGNTMSDNAMSGDSSRLQPMDGSESSSSTPDSRMAPTQNTTGTGDNPAANE